MTAPARWRPTRATRRLWQDDTTIKADKIVVEDKTGNLRATTNVLTSMVLTEPEDKSRRREAAKPESRKPTTDRTADDLLYEDAKHRATYTRQRAHERPERRRDGGRRSSSSWPNRAGQLERAEADGNVVSRQDTRRAYGTAPHLLAKDALYTMTGTPVKIYDRPPRLPHHRRHDADLPSLAATPRRRAATTPPVSAREPSPSAPRRGPTEWRRCGRGI